MQPASSSLPSPPARAAADAGSPPPKLIVAPPSPPCSPRSMRSGLAGLHRAPGRRYPQPRCARPSAIVPRSRFTLAHPKRAAACKHVEAAALPAGSADVAPDEWMFLKLDEDLSDADDDGAVLSDGAADFSELHARATAPRDTPQHGAFVRAATLPAPVPAPVPLRAPVGGVANAARLRRRFCVPLAHHSATAAAAAAGVSSAWNGASRSYRYSSSFSSSDSDFDDLR